MNKRVIVPQADLDDLEQAREALCRLIELETDFGKVVSLRNISEQMWQLTHKKYGAFDDSIPEVEKSNLSSYVLTYL